MSERAPVVPELLPLPEELRGERVLLRPYRPGDGAETSIVGIWTHAGEYCGGTGFHGFDWAVPSLELGYFLHRDSRGCGYGTEAVRLVTDWGLRGLGARRIWAGCDLSNERSWRLLERCGYSREAHLRNHAVDHHGRLRDELIYAVTSDGRT